MFAKKQFVFSAMLSVTVLVSGVFAQEKATPASSGPQTRSEPNTQASGGRVTDERLHISNVGFWKKFATDGKGDFLEFTFDIVNKTETPIPLKLFVIGLNETDMSDAELRNWVEYPKWRKLDIEKKQHKLILLESIPVVKQEDVNAFVAKRDQDLGKKEDPTVPKDENKGKTLKDFLDYVQYIHSNPNGGIDLNLQGFENASFVEKPDPKKQYRITERALKTSVWGKLFAKYRVDRHFFNHIGIILYDTEGKKFVFRQFYRFKHDFKIN